MAEFIEYKQKSDYCRLGEQINEGKIGSDESRSQFFIKLFSDFTTEYKEARTESCIDLIHLLCNKIFQDQSKFNTFILDSPDYLIVFFHQCTVLLNNIDIEDKEKIIFYFTEMINNNSFSNIFYNFKGDLMLSDLYQQISENFDKCILSILRKMNLSAKFQMSIFRDYFNDHIYDFDFLILFGKCIDTTEDINALFQEFVLFPEPQMQNFALFCQIIILFFKNSLDLNIFVESQLYDLIMSAFHSNLPDKDIGYFLQITARLLDYDEILTRIEPMLLITLLKYKKNKSIIVPVMTIIYTLIEKEVNMNSSDFIEEFVDDDVISTLFVNLHNEVYSVRVKSLFLLNSLIVKSNYAIFSILYQKHENFSSEISQIIYEFFFSDDEEYIISALQLAYHVFINIKNIEGNDIETTNLINLWKENGICEAIEEFVEEDDKIAEEAEKIYQKIINYDNYIND